MDKEMLLVIQQYYETLKKLGKVSCNYTNKLLVWVFIHDLIKEVQDGHITDEQCMVITNAYNSVGKMLGITPQVKIFNTKPQVKIFNTKPVNNYYDRVAVRISEEEELRVSNEGTLRISDNVTELITS
jgi:hypothetical protein